MAFSKFVSSLLDEMQKRMEEETKLSRKEIYKQIIALLEKYI